MHSKMKLQAAFHVLADHIRSSAMIISDGCSHQMKDVDTYYVKLFAALHYLHKSLSQKNIFPELVDPLTEVLGPIYPELGSNKEKIKSILASEIEKFATNLVRGQHILDTYFASTTTKTISGEQAFKLYDTFGFPLELIKVIAQERGFSVDLEAFEHEMEKQRLQSGKKS